MKASTALLIGTGLLSVAGFLMTFSASAQPPPTIPVPPGRAVECSIVDVTKVEPIPVKVDRAARSIFIIYGGMDCETFGAERVAQGKVYPSTAGCFRQDKDKRDDYTGTDKSTGTCAYCRFN